MKKIIFLLAFAFSFFAVEAQDSLKVRKGALRLEQVSDAQGRAVTQLPTADIPTTVTIQAPATDVTVNYQDPNTFFQEGFLGAAKAGVLAIIAALGAFLPGLRNIAASGKGGKFITSGVVAFAALTAMITFREGAFTEKFFTMITSTYLPNFGYSGLLYGAYNVVVTAIKRYFVKQATVAE